jgi:outer membrane protein OmpA-like peptidoglycan-associated protein
MTFSRLAVSLIALGLFAGPSLAMSSGAEPVVIAAAEIMPPAVVALLQDDRKAGELSDEQLTQRLRQARKLMQIEGLTPATVEALQQVAADAKAELARRSGAATDDGQAADDTRISGGSANGGDAGSDQTPQKKLPPIATQIPEDALAYLADKRDPGDLSSAELKTRIATGQKLMQIEGLPRQVRSALEETLVADKKAWSRRQTNAQADSGAADGGGDGNMQVVLKYMEDPRSPREMSAADITSRLALGDEIMNRRSLPAGLKTRIYGMQEELRAELKRRQTAGNGNVSGGSDGTIVIDGGGSRIDPADEARARDILADGRRAQSMDVRELRQRVQSIRNLLKRNHLSRASHDRLRDKLVLDRTVLRSRMAAVTGDGNGGSGNGGVSPGSTGADGRPVSGGIDPKLLNMYRTDRRPPRELSDRELRQRISITVNVLSGNLYPDERPSWQSRLTEDRAQLRERLLEERARRAAKLRAQRDKVILDQRQAQFDDLDAAEANDSELQDVLASAPRRKFDRRYSINDFENRPDLRDAVPRIEIDTIHFGFNEGFVREEEIDNLDRVAEIMERILSSNPNEVFLIEGHTDASGADYYNLGLSRQRAEAVVKALTTYYVIPARNLRTVGYGERFLKIPVDGPEPENRRVSVSRITDVVSAN